jgi:hypothetical protein
MRHFRLREFSAYPFMLYRNIYIFVWLTAKRAYRNVDALTVEPLTFMA